MAITTTAARSRFGAGRSAADKFLSITLGDRRFAIPIRKVQEVIGLLDITPVPRLPAWVRGVINLRGKVIPVVDLRRKLGMPPGTDTKRTCIVVHQVTGADGQHLVIGAVVDLVNEVHSIGPTEIEPPPSLGGGNDDPFITGVAKIGSMVVILLDIDRALSASEVDHIAEVATSG